MLIKLKLLVSVVLLACVFLPMSTCTYQVRDTATREMQEKVEHYYAIPPERQQLGVGRYLPLLLFVLPLVLVLVQWRQQASVGSDLVLLALSLLLLAYMAFYFYFTRPAVGGYLTVAAAGSQLLLALSSLVQQIRQHNGTDSGNDHHST